MSLQNSTHSGIAIRQPLHENDRRVIFFCAYKFDASTARLRRMARYQQNGLLDDHRFALALARNLTERGASRQAINAKLRGRGIAAEVVNTVFNELGSRESSELSAARALVKKRKLGNYRNESERRDNYRQDLGVLARAGFDFDTANRALSVEGTEPDPDFG